MLKQKGKASRAKPIGNGVAEPAAADEMLCIPSGEHEEVAVMGFCGVCKEVYFYEPDSGSRCPLCGYRIGDP